MKSAGHAIKKVVHDGDNVVITLKNGIVLDLSSNKNYFHLHFSGIELPMIVSGNVNYPQAERITLPNYAEIGYIPTQKD